jgi:hypothetical protein
VDWRTNLPPGFDVVRVDEGLLARADLAYLPFLVEELQVPGGNSPCSSGTASASPPPAATPWRPGACRSTTPGGSEENLSSVALARKAGFEQLRDYTVYGLGTAVRRAGSAPILSKLPAGI